MYVNPDRIIHFDPSIYKAAKEGNLTKIEEFIKQGGWVNIPDSKRNSMLYYACKKDQTEVVEFLLNHGAQNYRNLKGEGILESANEQIQTLVKKTEAVSVKCLGHLIEGKAAQFESKEEALQFIRSIPHARTYRRALKDYVSHLVFSSHDAHLILDHVKGPEKIIVEETLVREFLSFGDISSAKYVAEQASNISVQKFLTFHIQAFENDFKKLEKNINNDPINICNLINKGLNTLSLPNLSEETLECIHQEIAKCRSLAEVSDYTRFSTDAHKGFVRSAIDCILNPLQKLAAKSAENLNSQNIETLKGVFESLLMETEKTENFAPVIAFAAYYKDCLDNLYLSISCKMCEEGKYEEVYQLVINEVDPATYEYEVIIDELIDFFKRNSEEGWAKTFANLRPYSPFTFAGVF